MAALAEVAPRLICRKVDAVDESEDDELKSRPVPDAGEQHREYGGVGDHCSESAERRQGLAGGLLPLFQPVALHREQDWVVEVESDVTGERHVPALPVLSDTDGLERRVEVERNSDGEDAG